MNNWTAALGSRKFMGGDMPNLAGANMVEATHPGVRLSNDASIVDADIAFFGVLRAVEGFDTHKDVMANTTLGPWCES